MCDCCFNRTRSVFAKGTPMARLMIVGMCPGAEEDKVGVPFVGRSGQLLDKTLIDLGYPKVYITNLLKCYVKPGRKLEQAWVDTCKPFLKSQIEIIKPRLIVTLGADASFALINPSRKYMKDVRGNVWETTDGLRILPTYHPSWVLRRGGYGTESWRIMRNDLEKAMINVQ